MSPAAASTQTGLTLRARQGCGYTGAFTSTVRAPVLFMKSLRVALHELRKNIKCNEICECREASPGKRAYICRSHRYLDTIEAHLKQQGKQK